MMHEFPSGPVRRDAYERAETSGTYQSMCRFSESFLARNRAELSAYGRQWSNDPLSDWSRRWEYPFVGSRLVCEAPERWLDAGAGLTFFPFWVKANCPATQITCLDFNPAFPPVFRQLAGSGDIDYRTGDLADSGLSAESFDVITCVSVMEHLPDPVAAASEIHRLLKPGGLLLLTFDIGLDGFSDLSGPELTQFLDYIGIHFEDENNVLAELDVDRLRAGGYVDTAWIDKRWPNRLPWRYPRLSVLKSALRKGRISFNHLKWLTFSCHALRKKQAETAGTELATTKR